MRKQPRPHQIAGIEMLRAGVREGHSSLLLVMPTGAGKTVAALELSRLSIDKGKRVVFVTDRRTLVLQAAREASDYGLDVGIVMADAGPDWFNPRAALQMASKDTLLERAVRRGRIELPPADLVVIDEAHRGISQGWTQLLARWSGAVKVGLTATPIGANGVGLSPSFTWLAAPIQSSELLAAGLLVPTRCYAPYVPDLKGVRRGADGDYSKAELERRLNRKNLVGDVVGWWRKLANGRPTFCFGTTVAHSTAIAREFLDDGVPAVHIDADTDDADRAAAFDGLASGRVLVVCNVGVCCEGIDVPPVSCSILVTPTKSFSKYRQMAGRIQRPFPGKDESLLIDHAGCVLYHGFPDADVEWTLDGNHHDAVRKKLAAGEMPQPVCCPVCSTLFSGRSRCPACGHQMTRQAQSNPIDGRREGTLVEATTTGNGPTLPGRDVLEREWRKCAAMAVAKGRSAGMAAAVFRSRFGVAPWEVGMPHCPANWKHPAAEAFPEGFVRRKRAA